MGVHQEVQDALFVDRELSAELRALREKLGGRAEAVSEGDLLSFTAEELADSLLDSLAPAVPKICRDEISIVERNTGIHQYRSFGQTVRRELPRVVFEVPYRGDARLFFMRASSYSTTHPYAELNGDVLDLAFLYDGEASAVDEVLHSVLNRIDEHLSWQASDVEKWRADHRPQLVSKLSKRQETVAASRKVHEESRYPTRLRESGAVRVRLPRKNTNLAQPSRPSAESFLHLDREDVRDVLDVFRSVAKMFERHPGSFETLGEEALRDHFLAPLNAIYPGGVSGETFRTKGKTDILVTRDDKHVFVGECKNWSGPKGVEEAIDQLLGYLTWRDAWAALVIFSRRKDFAGVLSKVSPAVEDHPQYLRALDANVSDGEYRFQLKHPREDAGVLNLHILVFDVPSSE